MRWLAKHKAIAAVFGLTLLLLAGVETYRYAQAYRDLSGGRDLLGEAADLLERRGLDVTEEELVDSEERLVRAQDKLDSASHLLRSDPILSVASRLPWMGKQVDAARGLTDIGVESADIGLEAVETFRTAQEIRDTEGGEMSEKVVLLLDALDPHAGGLEIGLASVKEGRAKIPDSGLLGPLSSAVLQLDDRIDDLDARLTDYRRASRMAPKVLGYDGPQTYLVLAHDNTEILPAGGFVLVYGFITIDEGRLKRMFFDNVANIGEGDWPPTDGRTYIEPPQPLKAHLMRGWPMGLAEAAWWPDFPTAAEKAMEIYRTNNGSEERIDGVIGINFLTLEKLLEVLGPITVEKYGETVSAQDVIDKTLLMTHPEGSRLRPWESDRYDFTSFLAEEVMDRTLTAGPSHWAPLLSALGALGREKNLLLYHTDDAVQGVIEDMGWDGGIGQASGDFVMIVDSNLRRNKVNQVVEPSINLDIRLDAEGTATNVATVSYNYNYASWSQGRDPWLTELIIAGGAIDIYGSYMRLMAPEGSRLREVALGGLPVEVEEVSREGSRTSFGRFLTVPLNATREISYTYSVPSIVDMSDNPYEYRLFIQKQPGTRAVPLSITVEIPQGMELLSIELDGQKLEGKPDQIATDLRQDRRVVVRYAGRD